MKKILLRVGIVLVVLLVAGLVVVGLCLGNLVKMGMNTVGPKITQTTFTVESVNVSVFSGAARVNGLVIGNPDGFKTAQAISVGKAAVSIAPASLLSDKIVIKSVEVHEPEITFEGNPFGANNLKKIMENVNAVAASVGGTNAPATGGEKKAGKKLQVDKFLITGAKVHVSLVGMGGKEMTLPLPDINLHDLGTGPDGITPAELVKDVLGEITTATIKAVGTAVTDLGKGAVDAAKSAGEAVGAGVSKITKGLGGLFGK